MSQEQIEIKRAKCKHCGKPIARIPTKPEDELSSWHFAWIHYNPETDLAFLAGWTCSSKYAEPEEER